jgi:hypothetical protein
MSRKASRAARDAHGIAVKASYQLVPWAEMVVCHDRAWWDTEAAQGFRGIRVCGQEGAPDTILVPGRHERVEVTPGHVVEIASSGLLAVRVAAMTAPSRILLYGFDGGAGHWERRPARDPITAAATAKALEDLVAELRASGIEVEAPQ